MLVIVMLGYWRYIWCGDLPTGYEASFEGSVGGISPGSLGASDKSARSHSITARVVSQTVLTFVYFPRLWP